MAIALDGASMTVNVDPHEIEKFSQLAHRWWDPNSEFKPLHDINPLRMGWIRSLADLNGRRVLDVGCGGGILSEAMAADGAQVVGIDMSDEALKVAQLHLLESGAAVDYRKIAVEQLAEEEAHSFDILTCMEVLEHLPSPSSHVQACARLLRPGGRAFFATINRNFKSFLLAIIGAEYVLGLLPRGTHEYAKLIRPSELADWCRSAGLSAEQITGMTYNPVTRTYALSTDTDVNYMLAARTA
jgi:2-polyprenyl-6-hydroxyphenyl methylase/3-demethylubiquinone-9 3-methyltransferase